MFKRTSTKPDTDCKRTMFYLDRDTLYELAMLSNYTGLQNNSRLVRALIRSAYDAVGLTKQEVANLSWLRGTEAEQHKAELLARLENVLAVTDKNRLKIGLSEQND